MRLLFICSQHLWLREVFCSDIWYKVRSERVRVGLMAGRGWEEGSWTSTSPSPTSVKQWHHKYCTSPLPRPHLLLTVLVPSLILFDLPIDLSVPTTTFKTLISSTPPPSPKHIFLQDSYTFPITADWGLVYTWAFLIFTIRYDTLLMCNILSYTASLQIFHDIKI